MKGDCNYVIFWLGQGIGLFCGAVIAFFANWGWAKIERRVKVSVLYNDSVFINRDGWGICIDVENKGISTIWPFAPALFHPKVGWWKWFYSDKQEFPLYPGEVRRFELYIKHYKQPYWNPKDFFIKNGEYLFSGDFVFQIVMRNVSYPAKHVLFQDKELGTQLAYGILFHDASKAEYNQMTAFSPMR